MAAKKILIIDPDAVTRAFVSNVLRQQMYSVIQVGSAKEGLITAWRDRPDLILIEPLIPDLSDEALVTKLRQDRRTERTPLVAFTEDGSPARRKACTQAGFADFIVKTPDAVPALIASIGQILGTAPEQEETEPLPAPIGSRRGLSIFFMSAKGGVGTSSLCANLAMNIAQNEPDSNVVVVDLVLPIGSIAPIVGYEGSQNIINLVTMDPEDLAEELRLEPPSELRNWRFHVIAGSPDPDSAAQLRVERIGGFLQQLKSEFDFVIVDAGRSLSKFSMPLIRQADLVVLIVSTDLSSITLTKTLLDYLRSKGIKDRSIFTILNRAVGLEGLSRAEAEKALGIDIKTTFPYLVHFTLANNQHQPFAVKYQSETTATIAFKEVAERIAAASRMMRGTKEPQ